MRHTGFLISRMGMVAQKQFAERIESLGLTPRMWGALNVLDAEGAITQHALGKCVGSDPSSMVSTIDELEARGSSSAGAIPSDRRAHALHVTTKGRQTLTRGRELADAGAGRPARAAERGGARPAARPAAAAARSTLGSGKTAVTRRACRRLPERAGGDPRQAGTSPVGRA